MKTLTIVVAARIVVAGLRARRLGCRPDVVRTVTFLMAYRLGAI
jgi:hypothetical protein